VAWRRAVRRRSAPADQGISRRQHDGELQQGQSEQGQEGTIDQESSQSPLPGGIQELDGKEQLHQLQGEGEHEDQGQQAETANGHGRICGGRLQGPVDLTNSEGRA
jgi:hypothetical protein